MQFVINVNQYMSTRILQLVDLPIVTYFSERPATVRVSSGSKTNNYYINKTTLIKIHVLWDMAPYFLESLEEVMKLFFLGFRTLRMEEYSIETSVTIYQSTRRHAPEDFYLHQSRENVEFRGIKNAGTRFVDIFTKQTNCTAISLGRITSGVEAPSCFSLSSARSCCTYLSDAGPVPDILCGSTISERVVTKGVMVSILRKGIDSLQSRNVRQVHFIVPKDRSVTRKTISNLQLQRQ